MKTTAGKTKTPANRLRPIRIYSEGDGKLLNVIEADTLKGALEIYYERTLQGYGCTKPKHTGNTLTVTNKRGKTQLYVALEVSQEHVLAKVRS